MRLLRFHQPVYLRFKLLLKRFLVLSKNDSSLGRFVNLWLRFAASLILRRGFGGCRRKRSKIIPSWSRLSALVRLNFSNFVWRILLTWKGLFVWMMIRKKRDSISATLAQFMTRFGYPRKIRLPPRTLRRRRSIEWLQRFVCFCVSFVSWCMICTVSVFDEGNLFRRCVEEATFVAHFLGYWGKVERRSFSFLATMTSGPEWQWYLLGCRWFSVCILYFPEYLTSISSNFCGFLRKIWLWKSYFLNSRS
jgi:hypothetical protein